MNPQMQWWLTHTSQGKRTLRRMLPYSALPPNVRREVDEEREEDERRSLRKVHLVRWEGGSTSGGLDRLLGRYGYSLGEAHKVVLSLLDEDEPWVNIPHWRVGEFVALARKLGVRLEVERR
jgi:hypothetical protein